MRTSIGTMTLRALCLICLFGPGIAVNAAEPAGATYDFDIPAESLNDALQAFALASRHKLFYSSDLVVGKTSPAVKGRYTTDAALKALLSRTHLKYEVTSTGLVMIRAEDAAAPAEQKSAPQSATGSTHGADREDSRSRVDETASEDPPDSAQHKQTLEEVVVTAQLYRQPTQEVPMSLDVISSDELQQRGITSLDELQYAVPGMHVQGGTAQPRIFLRGISNWNGNGSEVSQYLDDADITAQGVAGTFGYAQFDMLTYDLQRVEVLRGPQGTLYGAGAEGGTIRFITRQPVLDRFQTGADISASFMPSGAPSQRIDAMVNTPLIPGDLALRVVGEFDNEGGWIDEPAANIKNLNSTDIVNVRMEALWQPTGRLVVKLMQLIDRNSFGINHGEDAQLGVYNPVFGVTTPGHGQRQGNLTNLTISYDLDSVRLLSSSTYFSHQSSIHDWALYSSPEGPPAYYTELQNAWENDKDFSQELRLSNTGTGAWQWTAGAFYQRDTDEGLFPYYFAYNGDTFVDPATAPLPPLAYVAYPKEASKSSAIFANVSYRVFDRVTLGAGGRYFRNQYEYMYPDVTGSGQLLPGPSAKATFTSSDPRFFVDVKMTSHINVYASVAKGFRSGGFNYTPTEPPFGPESVWSYELGAKMRLLGGRLTADEDVFYTTYKDYVVLGYFPAPQVPGFLDFLNENVGQARIKGVEVNASWRLLDNWSIGFNGDYLDAKLVSLGSAQNTGYSPGDELPFVPKYSAAVSLQRAFQWAGRPGYAALYYSDQSSVQFRQYGPPAELGQSDAIHMLNLSAGVQWNDNLRFGISAQNLLDDRGFVDPFHQTSWDWSARERPRTYGLNFGFQFD